MSDKSDQLEQYIIYRCVVGSQAYGLADERSDVNVRGIYLPPATEHWSLASLPEQLENEAEQTCFWEIEKFIRLALKSNPTILEALFSPVVEFASPMAEQLLKIRNCFLSKLAYQTYQGYAVSQFQKMQQRLLKTGDYKRKHAMHLIRVLQCGVDLLQTGELSLVVPEDRREILMSIRQGDMNWEGIDQLRNKLHVAFEEAYQVTVLPDEPDFKRVNEYLIEARKSMV